MEIVIDISKDIYNDIVNYNLSLTKADELCRAVVNGTPLEEQPTEECEENGSPWCLGHCPYNTDAQPTDAVSREAVIQIIENKLNPCTDMFKCLEMSEIKEDVEHLPSVQPQRMQGMDKAKLDAIERYLIDNVFENPDVMFSDECRGEEIDLVSIIAGMFEYLHIMVKGEPYEYMFHWANKIGAWVEEKRFDEMICRIMKEEQDE